MNRSGYNPLFFSFYESEASAMRDVRGAAKKAVQAVGRYFRLTDKLLLLFCMAASALGIVLITAIAQSDTYPTVGMITVKVQIVATALGLVGAIIISEFDYHFLARIWKIHAPLVVFLVLLTFFIGLQRGEVDDRAWLPLPFGLSLQPSELLKISFILTFSLHLSKVSDNLNSLSNLALLCLHGAFPCLLIHFQGDDGTALIFFLIFGFMLVSAGLAWRYILAAVTAVAVAAPIAWNFVLSNDQKLRILAVYFPEKASAAVLDQQAAGKLAIGSGQIWGNGLFHVENREYIPEAKNDFIFAFAGESLGYVGCIAIILLLTAICLRILLNARHAADPLGSFIYVGVFANIACQAVINIGMCISVLPVVGVTLPFFSAGGTSIVSLYAGIGLALSVYRHSNTSLFHQT